MERWGKKVNKNVPTDLLLVHLNHGMSLLHYLFLFLFPFHAERTRKCDIKTNQFIGVVISVEKKKLIELEKYEQKKLLQ